MIIGVLANGISGRLTWIDVALGMIVLGVLAWMLRRALSRWFGIARGDIRLPILIGAFLGLKLGLLALFLGCLVILSARPFFSGPIVFEGHYFPDGMPAGPSIALGAVIAWIVGAVVNRS